MVEEWARIPKKKVFWNTQKMNDFWVGSGRGEKRERHSQMLEDSSSNVEKRAGSVYFCSHARRFHLFYFCGLACSFQFFSRLTP